MLCAEIGVVNQPKNFGVSLPGVDRQCAVAYTDFWESCKTVIPGKRHRPVGQETGQTNPIERLNIAISIVVRYRVLGFEESGVRSQESGVKILVYLMRLGNAIIPALRFVLCNGRGL